MRVVFYSYGTRGDAQPQVVLASELRDRGYQVRVAAPENLRRFVEQAGVEYAPLHGNSQEILESEEGKKWLSSGNARAFMKAIGGIMNRINPEIFRTAAAAAEGADAIVGGTLVEDLSCTLAQKRNVPFILGYTIPLETTGAYPSPVVSTAQLPSFLNRMTYPLFRKLAWEVNRPTLNPYRESIGLPPLKTTIVGGVHEHGSPALQLWSEHVLPKPADAAPQLRTTGYIRMPAAMRARLGEATPSRELVDWLSRGPAPVYLGFGSMPVLDPLAMAKQILAMAEDLNLRVVLSAGWTDLSAVHHLAGDRMFLLHSVDHSWLLPQCAAAVHHGGAGTAAASMEAGVPTVVCSVFADQPFWGARVKRLGVGAHVPFAKLNQKTLTSALRSVLREDVRQRAATLGAKLRAEDGTKTTVEALIQLLGASPARNGLRAVGT
jgi:sterol 3beta-glucosyltransferase